MSKLSPNGEGYLKARETLCLTPYRDSAGKWTVGWGHLMGKEENKAETITVDKAKELFARDLAPAMAVVNRRVSRQLTSNQFDALVILAFNIGVGAFDNSTLLRLLNLYGPDYYALEQWWKAWNKITIEDNDGELQKVVSNGLVNRRNEEWQIWAHADYTVH